MTKVSRGATADTSYSSGVPRPPAPPRPSAPPRVCESRARQGGAVAIMNLSVGRSTGHQNYLAKSFRDKLPEDATCNKNHGRNYKHAKTIKMDLENQRQEIRDTGKILQTRTLSSYERLLELEESIQDIKYDVIGLSETRRLGIKIEEHESFILCHVGHTPGLYGVGFLVNKKHRNNIESFIGLTERVAILNMNIQGFMLSILQVYAPTEAAGDAEIEEFYKTIDKALDTAHKTIILMGDFNAKVGHPRKDEHLVTKQFGYGTRNNRGQRLVDFALEHKLAIINTCFKKAKQKWTWRSPDGKNKNEIDYILSNQPKIFQDIGTLNLNFHSDHRIIRANIKLTNVKESRIKYTNNRTTQLKEEQEILKYRETLSEKLTSHHSTYHENTSVQTQYDNIINAITTSLKEAQSARQELKRDQLLSERTKSLLQRRKELQKTKNKTRTMKNELSALFKLVNRYMRNDYARYRNKTIEKHLKLTGSTKKAYKELRTSKTWIEGLKDSGIDINKRKDIITTATEFYKNLYSDKKQSIAYQNNTTNLVGDLQVDPTDHESEMNIESISQHEIIEAIKRLKFEKSPGSDYITNEALKTAYHILATPLDILFNLILQKSVTPTQWSESNIILIYKRGSKNIGNYRPISLLPTLYKLFSAIINSRISPVIEARQPVEQAGFRKLETLGPSFPIERGVRQGDPLSPIIFIAILEVVINKLNWSKRGIFIRDSYLSHLRFADDLVILSESSSQLQLMIEDLQTASTNVGLQINLSKTMAMSNSLKNLVKVNEYPLEYTDKYIYLGKTISFKEKNNELEIERRIQRSWNKYWSMKEVFKSDMPINLKTRIMNSSILPCLTYGCQTWKFTPKAMQKITTCQRAMERSMLKYNKCKPFLAKRGTGDIWCTWAGPPECPARSSFGRSRSERAPHVAPPARAFPHHVAHRPGGRATWIRTICTDKVKANTRRGARRAGHKSEGDVMMRGATAVVCHAGTPPPEPALAAGRRVSYETVAGLPRGEVVVRYDVHSLSSVEIISFLWLRSTGSSTGDLCSNGTSVEQRKVGSKLTYDSVSHVAGATVRHVRGGRRSRPIRQGRRPGRRRPPPRGLVNQALQRRSRESLNPERGGTRKSSTAAAGAPPLFGSPTRSLTSHTRTNFEPVTFGYVCRPLRIRYAALRSDRLLSVAVDNRPLDVEHHDMTYLLDSLGF
ncbi:Craniofacial development protein 2 [Eumeta japonica]|uniref:Craniofacial development protein 2 n=1 Tax=Eumeta variegata TaxID=151549 RepID=A0A4C1Y0F6_EUMVA|nr:Craniofacial development protein 2 [Eumeta japonica]